MARNDGSIYFQVEVDNKDAQTQLKELRQKIEELNKQIEQDSADRDSAILYSDELAKSYDMAKKKLMEMKAAEKGAFSKYEIAAQKAEVDELKAAWDAAAKRAEKLTASVQKQEKYVEKVEEEAGELEQQLKEAEKPSNRIAKGFNDATKGADKLKSRVAELVKSALIFSVISAGLRELKSYLVDIAKKDAGAAAAIAQLQGALLTLAQPLLGVVIPAFTAFLQVLTAVVGRVAQLLSGLFGTTAKQSAQAAKALNTQSKALGATGAAAQKAAGSLAAFDEINKLTDSTASGSGAGGAGAEFGEIQPDFSWADGLSDELKKIGDAVLMIAAGLALWKVAQSFPGILGTILTKLGGLMIAVGGLILLWNGLSDAWKNGIDWKNAIAMIGGAAAAIAGLWIAIGPVAAGIAGVVAGIAMMVTGFHDAMDSGWNLQNALVTIAGILATGLGFALITTSMIPAFIAGISAALLAITLLTGNGGQLVENLRMVFDGLRMFIVGLFSGDIKRALEGLKLALKGFANAGLTIIGSFVNLVIKGLNWLIEKINSIHFEIPEWVPGIGGKKFSPNIPAVKEWQIPQLAAGAVIPPNREFLAVLGDQTRGNNIETPEDLLRQIVREEAGAGGQTEALLRAILAAIREGKVLTVDRNTFARLVYQANQSESARVGVSFSGK